MNSTPTPNPKADQTLSRNMTLLAHHEMNGFGGLGEGINLQITKTGRRILWVAHESAPKNFSGLDVTDPKNPRLIVQTDLPHMQLRSNSLDVYGDILAVAYQTKVVGLKPAGVDLFDISNPEEPKLLSHFDCSGPHSRGATPSGLLMANIFTCPPARQILSLRIRWMTSFIESLMSQIQLSHLKQVVGGIPVHALGIQLHLQLE